MSLSADHIALNAVDPTAATPIAAAPVAAAPSPLHLSLPRCLSFPQPSLSPLHPSCTTPVSTPCTMSSDTSCMLGSYSHLPMLMRDNYQGWQMAVKVFHTPYNHVHVITRTWGPTGNLVNPVRLTDMAELKAWETSEGITMGIVAGTSYVLHPNIVAKHEGRSVLAL